MDSNHDHESHVVMVDGKPILAPDERDPKSSSTMYVGVLGVMILVLSFVGLQAMFRAYEQSEKDAKIVMQSSPELDQYEQNQAELLTGYRIVDPEKKTVAIPIDRAMSIVTKELKSR